jgi:hypothetical protein
MIRVVAAVRPHSSTVTQGVGSSTADGMAEVGGRVVLDDVSGSGSLLVDPSQKVTLCREPRASSAADQCT